jgi:hypothetical protein
MESHFSAQVDGELHLARVGGAMQRQFSPSLRAQAKQSMTRRKMDCLVASAFAP